MRTRVSFKKIFKFAEQAGADFSKDKEAGRYANFTLYEFTKLYHDDLVKRVEKRMRKELVCSASRRSHET